MKSINQSRIILAGLVAMSVNVAHGAEPAEEAVTEPVKPTPAKAFTFKDEPYFFKGSGSCEGVEYSDLNKDGIRDIVSGVPSGKLHVYYGVKGEKGITYGEKQVLKHAATGEDIHVNHW